MAEKPIVRGTNFGDFYLAIRVRPAQPFGGGNGILLVGHSPFGWESVMSNGPFQMGAQLTRISDANRIAFEESPV
jgi:hypothetical protein